MPKKSFSSFVKEFGNDVFRSDGKILFCKFYGVKVCATKRFLVMIDSADVKRSHKSVQKRIFGSLKIIQIRQHQYDNYRIVLSWYLTCINLTLMDRKLINVYIFFFCIFNRRVFSNRAISNAHSKENERNSNLLFIACIYRKKYVHLKNRTPYDRVF